MSRNTRLLLAAIAFLCIAGGAFQPFYWRMFVTDRAPMRAALTELPYRRMPGLRRFMTAVRERTRDGDRIAIILPARRWAEGYEYGFMRSTYLLYGRTTVPVLDPLDHAYPRNVLTANVIAAFGVDVVAPHFRQVWRSNDGVLLQRTP
jgi:hypothetical protein